MKATKTVVTVETSYDIVEVKTVWTDEEAGKLLASGWILLHGGVAHRDGAGYQAKPVFVLGRKATP